MFSVKTGSMGTLAFKAALAKPSLSFQSIWYWWSPNWASYTPPGASPRILPYFSSSAQVSTVPGVQLKASITILSPGIEKRNLSTTELTILSFMRRTVTTR